MLIHIENSAAMALEPFFNNPEEAPANFTQLTTDMLDYARGALASMESKLRPIPAERLHQLITRLLMHFAMADSARHGFLTQHYTLSLNHYPEDMLCAAYQNILLRSHLQSLPDVATIIAFIEPEMQRRRSIKNSLTQLLSK